MTSANDKINSLHVSYCEATGYELSLNPVSERNWFDAMQWGLEPDDVRLIVKSRMRGIAKGERRDNSILIRNICGSEDALAQVMEELAAIKAKMRVKVLPAGKQDVLRATGRSPDVETDPAKHIREVALLKTLREAAG